MRVSSIQMIGSGRIMSSTVGLFVEAKDNVVRMLYVLTFGARKVHVKAIDSG